MKDNFEDSLQAVLKHEGGFVNHPSDPGGMTNLGCTKATWGAWVGHEVDEEVMRALTPADVAPLYKKKYWDTVKGDMLPSGIDYMVFDFAINSGPRMASKVLQRCVGAIDDGVIGPKTIAAVSSFNQEELIKSYAKRRIDFYEELPTWYVFGTGWKNRVNDVEKKALSFLAG